MAALQLVSPPKFSAFELHVQPIVNLLDFVA